VLIYKITRKYFVYFKK